MVRIGTISLGYGLASGAIVASITTFLNSPFVIASITGILSASGVIIAARIAANAQRETKEKLRLHGKALDSLMAGQFLRDKSHIELLEHGGFPLETDVSPEELQQKEQDADSPEN